MCKVQSEQKTAINDSGQWGTLVQIFSGSKCGVQPLQLNGHLTVSLTDKKV